MQPAILIITVSFQVYNKPMISNLFNYPNPFTTSTAFCIYGYGKPGTAKHQDTDTYHNREDCKGNYYAGTWPDPYRLKYYRIQVGRHRSIRSKLANGVYLYRVLTNPNGKSLDKFNTTGKDGSNVDTDKYFNKGYGKCT